jgi:ABC-2 type transport system ATP-binding protein
MIVQPIIIENVSKTYNKRSKYPTKALADVSFKLNSGEVTGLIGPNGAGKTTLLRILLGFEKPDTGKVILNDKHNLEIEARTGLGYQSDLQFRSKAITVSMYLEMQSKLAGFDKNKDEITYLMESFHLTGNATKNLAALSRGMRQKVELISAFIGNPSIVFLDEPTAALDPPSVFELRDFINKKRLEKITILFSSHHLTEVEKICDRVLFINNGVLSGDVDLKTQETGFLEEAFRKYETERKFI